MPKPTNKAIIITVTAAILGAGAGSGATYLVMDKQDQGGDLIRNAGPQNGDSPDVPTAQRDASLPEGTVSPHTVALEPHRYVDKQIKVRGLIIERGAPGQYGIVSQEANQPLALYLDFSKSNLDPKTYAAPAPGTKIESDKPPVNNPVTATGTLAKSDNNGVTKYTFAVQSIEK